MAQANFSQACTKRQLLFIFNFSCFRHTFWSDKKNKNRCNQTRFLGSIYTANNMLLRNIRLFEKSMLMACGYKTTNDRYGHVCSRSVWLSCHCWLHWQPGTMQTLDYRHGHCFPCHFINPYVTSSGSRKEAGAAIPYFEVPLLRGGRGCCCPHLRLVGYVSNDQHAVNACNATEIVIWPTCYRDLKAMQSTYISAAATPQSRTPHWSNEHGFYWLDCISFVVCSSRLGSVGIRWSGW